MLGHYSMTSILENTVFSVGLSSQLLDLALNYSSWKQRTLHRTVQEAYMKEGVNQLLFCLSSSLLHIFIMKISKI